jgi:hypothetical protein
MTDRAGWESDFPTFRDSPPGTVRERLRAFIGDASAEQDRAWADGIPPLQREVGEVLLDDGRAIAYSTILEYQLPMEARRPDVVLLLGAVVMVLELKGKSVPSQADLDQAAAYARDLRCYHRECHTREVIAVLVPTRARGYVGEQDGVHVAGPDVLDALVRTHARDEPLPLVDRARFLDPEAYTPLPTIVEAARELFTHGDVRTIHRARAATDPAVAEITRIVHEAAATRTRHLVLVTGVPGAGKTLVGLRAVHARYLDDLAVARAGGKPTAPAVFLSGNGPLVEVLQYELRSAGGGGKTFVRGVKDYVQQYSRPSSPVPPEHVLVFDEAQRAFDAEQMRVKHENPAARSEPDEFVRFADRIPEWSVVVGLIGTGQEIHVGEEGGVEQWLHAVRESPQAAQWVIHVPPGLADRFTGRDVPVQVAPALNLDTELRFHLASELHTFVARLLAHGQDDGLAAIARALQLQGYHLRMTRSLDRAKDYLRERYREDADARFGLIASSKDRDLARFGVPNDFQSTKRLRMGPWYGDAEDAYGARSCRLLQDCVTEFGAQGLELDAALVAWGTDFVRDGGRWSNASARGYKRGAAVRDPFQLRLNAYRVLLTRGRDATLLFVPPLAQLDETFDHLYRSGIKSLDASD